jgi:putative glutamine amidotransferase
MKVPRPGGGPDTPGGKTVVTRRPVIGVATQTLEAIPGKLPLAWVMGQQYVRVLTAAGALPWIIPLLEGDEATLRAIYEQVDGVFLTGGVDVDPARYGEDRHPKCGPCDPARDWTELTLVRWATSDGKPVLGVCRGHQVINVACGGTLYQDVPDQHPQAIKHDFFPSAEGYTRDRLVHPVRVVKGSRLETVLGAELVQVNSMHHQGIKTLAPGLAPSAYSPDGMVEGVEGSNGHFLLGVQWHPEELAENHPEMRRLFQAFIAAAGRYAEGGGR